MLQTMTCMEGELSTLRADRENLTTTEMRKRLAVISCQRKKEQAKLRRYQVATERLLMFVEVCGVSATIVVHVAN